jgi:drug/metabolite transporter (DMT)-like permease
MTLLESPDLELTTISSMKYCALAQVDEVCPFINEDSQRIPSAVVSVEENKLRNSTKGIVFNPFHKQVSYQRLETGEIDEETRDIEINQTSVANCEGSVAIPVGTFDVISLNDDEADCESQIVINKPAKTEENDDSSSKSWKTLIIACLSLACAMISGASVGPVFKFMEEEGIRPCLAASWRCQCMALLLFPLAIMESYSNERNRVNWFEVKPNLPYPLIIHVLFSGLAWAGNLLFWINALQFCTTFMAAILSCSHPILLVICMRFLGFQLSWMECIGVMISFSGMITSCLQDFVSKELSTVTGSSSGDGMEGMDSMPMSYMFVGWSLCICASFCEVVVLFNRIATRKYIPLMQYTFATTFIVAICATLVSVIVERKAVEGNSPYLKDHSTEVLIFCRDDNCVFGWLSDKWIDKVLLFGLWVGVFCCAGANYAVRHSPFLSVFYFAYV